MLVSKALNIAVGIYLDSKRVSDSVHRDILNAIEQLKLDEFPDLEKGTIKVRDLPVKQKTLILGLGAYIVGTDKSEQEKLNAACELIYTLRTNGDFGILGLTLGYQ